MKDKEFVIEQKLCDIYYDPGVGFQFAGMMLVVGL